MKRFARTALFFAVISALPLGTGCASLKEKYAQKPKVELQTVSTRDMTLKGATVVFGLKLDNPNEIDLPLDDLTYKLYINDEFFAEGRTDEKVRIPAKGSSIVNIPLAVDYAKVIGGLAQVLQGKDLDYRLAGEAKFAFFSVPFDKKGDFKLTGRD